LLPIPAIKEERGALLGSKGVGGEESGKKERTDNIGSTCGFVEKRWEGGW